MRSAGADQGSEFAFTFKASSDDIPSESSPSPMKEDTRSSQLEKVNFLRRLMLLDANTSTVNESQQIPLLVEETKT